MKKANSDQTTKENHSFPREVNDHLTKIYFYLHYENQAKISHKSIRLLQLLEKREEVTVGDVAEFLKISPNTASENVKRLVKERYVKKEYSADDERKVYLHLTPQGKEIVRLNTNYDEDKLAIIFDNLDVGDRQRILDGFTLLSRSCEQLYLATELSS